MSLNRVPNLSRGGHLFLRIMIVLLIVSIALFAPADLTFSHP